MISFELSEEQQLVKDTVAGFSSAELRPLSRAADEAARTPDSVVAKAWELGLVASGVPEAFGGYGDARSAVTGAIALEELGHGDLSFALHSLAPRLLVYPLVEYGTDEQKARLLSAFTGGAFRAGTAAVIEPSMHFDLSALETTARREGGEWVIDGQKMLVPLGSASETILVYARRTDAANGHARNGYAAVEGFLVPRGAAGLTIVGPERNMGVKALETSRLRFEGVRVPESDRLGGDRGIDFAAIMNRSRVALSALAVGVARAAYEYALDYAKERKAFGVAIAQKQAIAFMLAEMAIEIDATRLLVWEAAWKIDRGEDATREAVLAKSYAAEMALNVTDHAVQVLGGHGYVRDHMVELWLRNARGFAAFEGLAIV